MPFLRFSRDKRGYESTYLCHTFRRGGKPQLRVLYWFRTPPDVKVGRLALDPVAIRAIEESNPDLKFDWGKILKVKPTPPPPDYGDERRARRRRGRATGVTSEPAASGAISASVQGVTPEPVASVEAEAERSGPESAFDAPAPAIAAWDDPDPGGEPASPAGSGPAHVVLGLTDEQGWPGCGPATPRSRPGSASGSGIQPAWRICGHGSRCSTRTRGARWMRHASAWRRSMRRPTPYVRCSDVGAGCDEEGHAGGVGGRANRE